LQRRVTWACTETLARKQLLYASQDSLDVFLGETAKVESLSFAIVSGVLQTL